MYIKMVMYFFTLEFTSEFFLSSLLNPFYLLHFLFSLLIIQEKAIKPREAIMLFVYQANTHYHILIVLWCRYSFNLAKVKKGNKRERKCIVKIWNAKPLLASLLYAFIWAVFSLQWKTVEIEKGFILLLHKPRESFRKHWIHQRFSSFKVFTTPCIYVSGFAFSLVLQKQTIKMNIVFRDIVGVLSL